MELEYKIVRSAKRKKLTITVERDKSIVVHAPENVSEAMVQQVVEEEAARFHLDHLAGSVRAAVFEPVMGR